MPRIRQPWQFMTPCAGAARAPFHSSTTACGGMRMTTWPLWGCLSASSKHASHIVTCAAPHCKQKTRASSPVKALEQTSQASFGCGAGAVGTSMNCCCTVGNAFLRFSSSSPMAGLCLSSTWPCTDMTDHDRVASTLVDACNSAPRATTAGPSSDRAAAAAAASPATGGSSELGADGSGGLPRPPAARSASISFSTSSSNGRPGKRKGRCTTVCAELSIMQKGASA
mmetsp:Transcript_7672/g.17717  ORF Transcript_7672/g.17717 Transcript_7672/m.17717 type:complete len:226 (+) Transcript_7672:253-930(+)